MPRAFSPATMSPSEPRSDCRWSSKSWPAPSRRRSKSSNMAFATSPRRGRGKKPERFSINVKTACSSALMRAAAPWIASATTARSLSNWPTAPSTSPRSIPPPRHWHEPARMSRSTGSPTWRRSRPTHSTTSRHRNAIGPDSTPSSSIPPRSRRPATRRIVRPARLQRDQPAGDAAAHLGRRALHGELQLSRHPRRFLSRVLRDAAADSGHA